MFVAFALSLMLAAAAEPAPATSSKPAVAQDAASAASKRDGARMKCRRELRANSRLPERVCKTEAQWEADAEAARKQFNELQNKTQANPG